MPIMRLSPKRADNFGTLIHDPSIHPTAYIGPGCVIGSMPEIRDLWNVAATERLVAPHSVKIGAHAILTANVRVDAGSRRDTIIGINCFIMNGVYIAHDCLLESNVTIAAGACLAGHVSVHAGAYIGMNASIHQWQVIGAYAMIGMGAVIPKLLVVRPGYTYVGNPARCLGVNHVGLERAGLTLQDVEALDAEFFESFFVDNIITHG